MESSLKEKLDQITSRGDFFIPSTRRKRWTMRPFRSLLTALLVRASRISGWRFKVQATTFWGDSMRVLLPDGAAVYLWGFIDGEELNLTKYLVENVTAGNVFIDIGAHFGYNTLLAATIVGPGGQVHAFEPTPRSFRMLKANVDGKQNVTVNQKALWKQSGSIQLLDFGPEEGRHNAVVRPSSHPSAEVPQGYAAQTRTISVDTITLDEYCDALRLTPSLIKMDAEGVEYEIMLGSRSVLKTKPILSVEVWGGRSQRSQDNQNIGRIIDFLSQYSYKPYRLERGKPSLFSLDDNFDFVNLIFLP